MEDGQTGEGCEFIGDCQFYTLFGNGRDHLCSRFARVYCTGPLTERCEKRRYWLRHGRPPGFGMMPTGETFADASYY